jgi:hypothetical protein
MSEIVMYVASLDERTLIAQHQGIKDIGQPLSQALGDELAKAVDESYGTVVMDLSRVLLLQKYHLCII